VPSGHRLASNNFAMNNDLGLANNEVIDFGKEMYYCQLNVAEVYGKDWKHGS